jgi:hypothetical protein
MFYVSKTIKHVSPLWLLVLETKTWKTKTRRNTKTGNNFNLFSEIGLCFYQNTRFNLSAQCCIVVLICGSNLPSFIFLCLLTRMLPLLSFVEASPSLFSFCNSYQTKENYRENEQSERERQRTIERWCEKGIGEDGE